MEILLRIHLADGATIGIVIDKERRVIRIEEGSEAANRFEMNDKILQVNGRDVHSVQTFRNFMRRSKNRPNDIQILVQRVRPRRAAARMPIINRMSTNKTKPIVRKQLANISTRQLPCCGYSRHNPTNRMIAVQSATNISAIGRRIAEIGVFLYSDVLVWPNVQYLRCAKCIYAYRNANAAELPDGFKIPSLSSEPNFAIRNKLPITHDHICEPQRWSTVIKLFAD